MKSLFLSLTLFSVLHSLGQIKNDGKPQTMISSSQVLSYISYKIGDVSFGGLTDGKDTVYRRTEDEKFYTPEKYKVGMMLSELPDSIQKNLAKVTGWGYYYKLPSGWMIAFCEGASCTDYYPKNTSKIKYIYKQNKALSHFN